MIAGWDRTATICEHKSAEHVAQTLASAPLGAFLNFEAYPLANFNEAMKANIEAAKMAEKLFPAPPK